MSRQRPMSGRAVLGVIAGSLLAAFALAKVFGQPTDPASPAATGSALTSDYVHPYGFTRDRSLYGLPIRRFRCPVATDALKRLLGVDIDVRQANHGGSDTVCAFTGGKRNLSITISASRVRANADTLVIRQSNWLQAGETLTGRPALSVSAFSMATDHGAGMGIAAYEQSGFIVEVQVGDHARTRDTEATAVLIALHIIDTFPVAR